MKTKNIVTSYHNTTSPAARLAAWQARHPVRRLKQLRNALGRKYSPPATLTEARREAVAAQGPELSAPDAESPLLWSAVDGPEILEAYAGRIALDHYGWYQDEHEDETLETYAVRLLRFPRLMFYAVRCSLSGDSRVHLDKWEEIDFSECESDWHVADAVRDSARNLIRAYDDTTRREAEDSREYYRRDQVERDIEENKETLRTLRQSIRALARELKALCPSPLASDYPAAASAVRARLSSMLKERAGLHEENQKLAASL